VYLNDDALFCLQMKELLAEISVTQELQSRVEEWMEGFKEFATSLPSSKTFSVGYFVVVY